VCGSDGVTVSRPSADCTHVDSKELSIECSGGREVSVGQTRSYTRGGARERSDGNSLQGRIEGEVRVSLFLFFDAVFLVGAVGGLLRWGFFPKPQRSRVGPIAPCRELFSGLVRSPRTDHSRRGRWGDQGFSMLEVALVLAITMILTAFSLPWVQNTLTSYHLSSAIVATTGAIQSTRYRAIMSGCPYTISFGATSTEYQVAQEVLSGNPPTCASTFTNVGGAIPWATTSDVTLSPSTTLQFSPNGTVTATVGSLTFSLTNGLTTESITVSGVGDVTVSP
jgi:Tfp pilus assembly protein FimT